MSSAELRSLHQTLLRSLVRAGEADSGIDAEDYAQMVWCRLLEQGEALDSVPRFALGVCKRLTLMSWSRRARRRRLQDQLAAYLEVGDERSSESVATRIDDERTRADIERAVRTIEAPRRWLLEQRLVEERSFAAILPEWQRRFGDRISTVEGLRTAVFHTRKELIRALRVDA